MQHYNRILLAHYKLLTQIYHTDLARMIPVAFIYAWFQHHLAFLSEVVDRIVLGYNCY